MTSAIKTTLCRLPTPCYVIDEGKLEENAALLHSLEEQTGCHVLLAQKAFSVYQVYPLLGQYLSGTTASGLFEAKLGQEEMGKENHVFAPAYKAEDMASLVSLCDHIVFNSYAQYSKHRETIVKHNAMSERKVSLGIRVNPECSTQEGHAIYDPCAFGSRLGMTYDNFFAAFGDRLPSDIEGLHFHTLCEQDADDLVKTFYAFEKKFAHYLTQIQWLNLGGGHHITRKGYKIEELKKLIGYIRSTYHLDVYLEPGEAVALNAGYLVTQVEDVVKNGMDILVLDASAACHMPDVLEMPYRPPLFESGLPGEKKYNYRLSSLTCLAGDVIGDYSFDEEKNVGDKLIFEDMAIYSMVKNNTFNGIPLPAIYLLKKDGNVELMKKFGYRDFKERL
jgi:carboxynorspermidine decarboxylase